MSYNAAVLSFCACLYTAFRHPPQLQHLMCGQSQRFIWLNTDVVLQRGKSAEKGKGKFTEQEVQAMQDVD